MHMSPALHCCTLKGLLRKESLHCNAAQMLPVSPLSSADNTSSPLMRLALAHIVNSRDHGAGSRFAATCTLSSTC